MRGQEPRKKENTLRGALHLLPPQLPPLPQGICEMGSQIIVTRQKAAARGLLQSY